MRECNSTPILKSCLKCKSTKLTYIGFDSTLVGYFSEPPHDHDDNCKIHMWKCENGHALRERQLNICPVEGCGWVGKADCFCSPLGSWVAEEGPAAYSF